MSWKTVFLFLGGLLIWRKRRNKFNERLDPEGWGSNDYIPIGKNYRMSLRSWEYPKLWGRIELRPPWRVRVHKKRRWRK